MMHLNKEQIILLSRYFSDVSKITFASSVIGFFIPAGAGPITIPLFIVGAFVTVSSLVFSIAILK